MSANNKNNNKGKPAGEEKNYQVIKRNGKKRPYNPKKIKDAVYKAAIENGREQEKAEDIAKTVSRRVDTKLKNQFFKKGKPAEIESIQDLVEESLMEINEYEVSKSYILYRYNRNQARKNKKEKEKETKLFTDDFISKYKHQENPFPTELGEFIFYRTYSRWLPEENRREYFWETTKRAVEYNTSLAPTPPAEAKKLFDNVFNMRNFLAGRTLYSGGTEVSKLYSMQNYNCSGLVINSLQSYKDMFLLLMLGSGVGFRVLPGDVQNLPKFRTDIDIYNEFYTPKSKQEREEFTNLNFDGENFVEIIVGDSKEGWIEALEYYLKILTSFEYRPIQKVLFNYNNVRPRGEKLETFGGTASGPQSLERMFVKINNLLKDKRDRKGDSKWTKLKPVDAMDIANIIAENVVSGGVRRSSQICLFAEGDEQITKAKNNLYIQKNGEWQANEKVAHRQMSNNTIMYENKPARDQLHWHMKQIRYSGEPGFLNAAEARRRREDFEVVNPCGEILLDKNGVCNLTSVNVKAFVDNDSLDREGLLEAQRLSARAGYRMTMLEFELPHWDQINKRDRLVGTSLTGWQDAMNALEWNDYEIDKNNPKNPIVEETEGLKNQKELLKELRKTAHKAAEEYAHSLGQNPPKLVTTVKPEGTQTQMPTVSSGLHFNHSPYYVRRVRINATDPLAKVCEELEYPVYPEVGQDPDNPQTKVIEFPVKAPEGRTKFDVSALEQLENYKMFMEHYVDHNASATIHVRDQEWEDVEEWLWHNWEYVVGLTFLSLSDNFYELMPYEAISKEKYEQRAEDMKTFQPSLVNKYERKLEDGSDIDEERGKDLSTCDNGVCPVR